MLVLLILEELLFVNHIFFAVMFFCFTLGKNFKVILLNKVKSI